MTVAELVEKLLTFDQAATVVVEDYDGFQTGLAEIKEGFRAVNSTDAASAYWAAWKRDDVPPEGWTLQTDKPCILLSSDGIRLVP